MESEASLNDKIMIATDKIQKDFPELTKFLNEMPFSPDEYKGVNLTSLKDYLNSLNELMENYAKEH